MTSVVVFMFWLADPPTRAAMLSHWSPVPLQLCTVEPDNRNIRCAPFYPFARAIYLLPEAAQGCPEHLRPKSDLELGCAQLRWMVPNERGEFVDPLRIR